MTKLKEQQNKNEKLLAEKTARYLKEEHRLLTSILPTSNISEVIDHLDYVTNEKLKEFVCYIDSVLELNRHIKKHLTSKTSKPFFVLDLEVLEGNNYLPRNHIKKYVKLKKVLLDVIEHRNDAEIVKCFEEIRKIYLETKNFFSNKSSYVTISAIAEERTEGMVFLENYKDALECLSLKGLRKIKHHVEKILSICDILKNNVLAKEHSTVCFCINMDYYSKNTTYPNKESRDILKKMLENVNKDIKLRELIMNI